MVRDLRKSRLPVKGGKSVQKGGELVGTIVRQELMTKSADVSLKFYAHLLGWTAAKAEDLGDTQYFHLRRRGEVFGGLYETPKDPLWQQASSHWYPIVHVDDAAAALSHAKSLGAHVTAEAFAFAGEGELALIQDPTGAPLGLSDGEGAASSAWHELASRDVARATDFYQALFGWNPCKVGGGDFCPLVFEHHGHAVAGLLGISSQHRSVPSHWLTYFPVENLQEQIEVARKLQARLLAPPTTLVIGGRQAVLADPAGAPFGLFERGEG